MAQHLLDNTSTFKHAVQQALMPDTYVKGQNLLLDMAIDSGVVKMIHEGREEALYHHGLKGLFHREALAMDPVKGLPLADELHAPSLGFVEGMKSKFGVINTPVGLIENPDTLQGMAHTLWHLAEQVSKPQAAETLQHLVMATQGSKALALGASLMLNYVALAHVTPKFKHWLSKHASGSNWTDSIGQTSPKGQQAGTTHTSSSAATLSGNPLLNPKQSTLAVAVKNNPFVLAQLNHVQGSYTPPLPWVMPATTNA